MLFRLSRFFSFFSPLKQASYGFTVQKKYLDLIREGKKTVEGRVNQRKYQKIHIGDLVAFKSSELTDPSVLCVVKEKKIYLTFKEMLQTEGVENCLPGVSSLDEALAIYHAFPGYGEKSLSHGVVAFRLAQK